MKKKLLAYIMMALGFGFIAYYVILRYNIERQFPTDAVVLGAAFLTAQLGLGWILFKD